MNDLTTPEIQFIRYCSTHILPNTNKIMITYNYLPDLRYFADAVKKLYDRGYVQKESTETHTTFTKKGLELVNTFMSLEEL